jgi:hypothetical protein
MVAYDPPGSSLGLLDVQCWARDPQAYVFAERCSLTEWP